MNRKAHWETVFSEKAPDEVSWYQRKPGISLDLIAKLAPEKSAAIIDIGGGASVLVDHLLELGYTDLSVLDIAGHALQASRKRIGANAKKIHWIETDVTIFEPERRFALWHDRAAFHFLIEAGDRRKYLNAVESGLLEGGSVIIGAFAKDGPPRCSGLDVRRYDARKICAEMGTRFELVGQVADCHVTPWGSKQKFAFFAFRFLGLAQ